MKIALASGEAVLVGLDRERVRLDSSVPAAPGTPLEGALDDGTAVSVKVARCVRHGERFSIEGRLVNATRALRRRLSEALSGGSTPSR